MFKNNEYLHAGEVQHLKRVAQFALNAHKGQMRKSGEPFVAHPKRMLRACIKHGIVDTELYNTIMLHDTVEDNPEITTSMIRNLCGDTVAGTVFNLTAVNENTREKIEKCEYYSNFENSIINGDWRTLITKMLDCNDNLKTISFLKTDKQILFVAEKLGIYLPIARRYFYSVPAQFRPMFKQIIESTEQSIFLAIDSFRFINPGSLPRLREKLDQLIPHYEKYIGLLTGIFFKDCVKDKFLRGIKTIFNVTVIRECSLSSNSLIFTRI